MVGPNGLEPLTSTVSNLESVYGGKIHMSGYATYQDLA